METIIRDMRAVRRQKMLYEAAQTTLHEWEAQQNADRIRRRIPEPYRSMVGPDVSIREAEEAIADLAGTSEEEESRRDPQTDISITEEPFMEDFDPADYRVEDLGLVEYLGIGLLGVLLLLMFRR